MANSVDPDQTAFFLGALRVNGDLAYFIGIVGKTSLVSSKRSPNVIEEWDNVRFAGLYVLSVKHFPPYPDLSKNA